VRSVSRPDTTARDWPGRSSGGFAAMFADDVRRYLAMTPRQLPSKYLYDELGSALFESITRLPWYQVTRAEFGLIARHAREILAPMRPPVTIAELGSGSGEKLARLLDAGRDAAAAPVAGIHLIDISSAALDMGRYRLEAQGEGGIVTHHCAYEDGLARVRQARPAGDALLILFLGSNIGNFDAPAARDLLRAIRDTLQPGDALLLGADFVKPERDLLLAYDDPLGVTAAFNLNVLRRINDELGGTFDLAGFAHRAVWNATESRVEMHLVSRTTQRVVVSGAELELELAAGDWIWTESSYKYVPGQLIAEGRAAGFRDATSWIDEEARFALLRFDA
jgi:dimethylhistidine N-methyltransferase